MEYCITQVFLGNKTWWRSKRKSTLWFPILQTFLLPSSDFPLKGWTGMAAFFIQALNSKKLSRTSLSCEVTLFPEGKVWYVRRFSGEMRWRCHIVLALSGGLKERGWEEQAHNGDMVISLVTDPRKHNTNVIESQMMNFGGILEEMKLPVWKGILAGVHLNWKYYLFWEHS